MAELGVPIPVSFSGLRSVITALSRTAPEAVRKAAGARPSEWNWLFPGTFPGAPPLADLAGTPSERRLHAESEQVFRVLDTAAEAVVAAITATGRPLHLRGVGHSDLVSLRGLPRIAERLALAECAPELRLYLHDVLPADHDPFDSPLASGIRRRMLGALAARLGVHGRVITPAAGRAVPETTETAEGDAVAEHRLLAAALEPQPEDPARAAAAALLAMRSCFFTCNYEGGVLAAEALLRLLGPGTAPDPDRIRQLFASLDAGDGTPAIGIQPDAVESVDQLRSLALRYLGMVQALVFDHAGARAEFTRAVEAAPDAVTEARVLLLRALLSVKRVGTLDSGIADIERGLARLSSEDAPVSRVERAWLRNVRALAHVRGGEYPAAMAEEKQAIALIGKLHSADATHLKINLISNVSVLQEMAGKYDAARRTWAQFARISSDWGDSFFKHHHYRAAGLSFVAGRHQEALEGFTASYDLAHALGDHLHQELIALEIGGMLLDLDRRDEAQHWYERAESAATALSDPYTLALARIGLALAAGTPLDSDAVRRTASLSCAQVDAAEELRHALDVADSGDTEKLQALLPRPRTKLNRPFLLTPAELEPVR